MMGDLVYCILYYFTKKKKLKKITYILYKYIYIYSPIYYSAVGLR